MKDNIHNNNNEINEIIDNVSKKFEYDEELNNALKRIVPYMIKGKSDEVKSMLFNTLNRVRIFVLPDNAKKEDIDKCEAEVFGDINKDVTFLEQDRGEYGKQIAAGAYVNEPVFDLGMNIVDRMGFCYISKLSKYDKLKEVYGSEINLSHLIHELGHAWASEKEEFIQDENGNYINNVGACTITSKVNKENKIVESTSYDALLIEESLNTIEEENVLCEVLGIENINELKSKGYVPSNYQGFITDIMRGYVEKFGKEDFDKFRFLKDREALKNMEESIRNTEAWETLQTEDYGNNKKKKFARVNELETTDGAKRSINQILSEYEDVYFPDNSKFTPMQKLENVFTQVYNFSRVKYSFDISKEKNLDIYKGIVLSMINEGYVLKNQVKEIVKEDKEQNKFFSDLKDGVKTEQEIAKSNNELINTNERNKQSREI